MDTVDVAIVGYGPTGMVLAALLGQQGHRVVVLDRYTGLYNLPRAATFDDEIMRTFQKLGVADAVRTGTVVQRRYEWCNADGAILIEQAFDEQGRNGWAEWYMMYQPHVESVLDSTCRALRTVEVRQGWRAVGVEQSDESVALSVVDHDGKPHRISARYLVGCDGGNSLVRESLGIGVDSYGFEAPWLVCDFALHRPGILPAARQICDPAQPTSIIAIGPDHHRISFMLDGGEGSEPATDPAAVWRRVRRWLTSDDADLIRAAQYTFRSLVARRWRDRNVFLAGDAAHQMPPFLGQGMCSGIRDAHNLAWKLDLVLNGTAGTGVLDSYQREREPHVRAITEKSIELGRVQTLRDRQAAAARDQRWLRLRADNAAPERLRFPGLQAGILAATDSEQPRSTVAIISDAVRAALSAARIDRHQIDALFTHRPPVGDNFLLFGQKLVAELKIAPTSTTAIMNHGAGMLSALKYGALLIEAGLADYVLCPSGDAAAAWIDDPVSLNANVEADAHFEAPYDPITPALYGQLGQRFVYERGLTEQDLATVAVAMRAAALEHPEAEMRHRGPLTAEQVLNSPMIASPSRLLHCAPWYHGSRAGAIILTRAENTPPGPRTYLRAVGETVTHEHISGRMGLNPFGPWDDGPKLAVSGAFGAARQAFAFAGMTMSDIDVVETVVPFAFLIPMMLENLGVCGPEGSPEFIRSGGLGPDGPVAFNTNGGMLSFGQCYLNCVMDQTIEALQQLDGSALGRQAGGAATALVHSHGGVVAANTVAIFERS